MSDNNIKTTNHFPYYAIFLVSVLFLDRLTKALAAVRLKGKSPVDIIPNVLQFLYLENRGAAFGTMQGQRTFFIIITCLSVVLIIFILLKLPQNKYYLPLGYSLVSILGGAIGNLIDRVFNHYVIDFIYFMPIDFPVFNIADIFVTLGAIMLFILILFKYKDKDFDFIKIK